MIEQQKSQLRLWTAQPASKNTLDNALSSYGKPRVDDLLASADDRFLGLFVGAIQKRLGSGDTLETAAWGAMKDFTGLSPEDFRKTVEQETARLVATVERLVSEAGVNPTPEYWTELAAKLTERQKAHPHESFESAVRLAIEAVAKSRN